VLFEHDVRRDVDDTVSGDRKVSPRCKWSNDTLQHFYEDELMFKTHLGRKVLIDVALEMLEMPNHLQQAWRR
jgi:hypothetical protein